MYRIEHAFYGCNTSRADSPFPSRAMCERVLWEWQSDKPGFVLPGLHLQANAATAAGARHPGSDQDNSVSVQCCDQFHQRVDVAADDTLAGFHALDRGNRQAALLRKLALVDSGERTRGTQIGRAHV